MKAVRRTRQILFLILPRRAERLKYTGPQFLAFEQSVVDIRRLQSFLVSSVFPWPGAVNKNASANHKKKIEGESKLLLEKELNRASRGVKEWKFSNGELNCSLEDVDSNKKFVPVTSYL